MTRRAAMRHALALASLCGTIALAGCRSSGVIAGPDTLGDATREVVMTYLIAHGMAESYVMSGRADPASLLDLVRYDHAALVALRGHELGPNWTTLSQARSAVRSLMDYTTRMDADGDPARQHHS
ncbi:hypothetical protein [Lichenicoccus sp.]|uniref:hypothetical protein n=1 Tax=Lichenicoccus sp. TaxID=2781899 RepID=UPI003D0AB521